MNEDKTYPSGLTKQKKKLSLVWIIPIVAILITAGMIWKSYVNKGTRIFVTIENGEGIMDGKTPLMYKGIKIGSVEDVGIKEDDVSMLQLTIVVDKDASEAVTREGNKFWKVEPKVSITEISGLDTLLKGVYISVMPASTTKEALLSLPYQTHFTALESAPVDVFRPGLALVVNTKTKGNIAIGAPVLYNKQVIGKVEDKKLSKDTLSTNLHLRIDNNYIALVHKDSVFYKASAVNIKAGLGGIKVEIGSFASFIAGGIGLFNSEASLSSDLAKENDYYELFDDKESLDLAKDEVILDMPNPHNLTAEISKVYCKGVEAGIVSSLKYNATKDNTTVKVKLFNDFRKLANEKAYFWLVKPTFKFDGIDGLDTIVRGNYINFVTTDPKAKKSSYFKLNLKRPKREGVHLKIISKDIQSLKEGAGLFYHNIKIGLINKYTINPDKKTITLDLVVEPKYLKLLNSSSLFYHNSGVELNADFTRVELKTGSLETILRGGIAVETPNFKASKTLKKSYKLYKSHREIVKAQYLNDDGVYLSLLANKLGSLKEGSPIFFKQIKVGEVLSYVWDKSNKEIVLKVFIIKEYANEVQENTLFYNASGIRAKMDLKGLEIDTESMETIMAGGIAFYTPLVSEPKKARNKSRFFLYENKKKAMDKFVDLTLISEDSSGLEEGSPLKYKNVTLGYVDSVHLVKNRVHLHLKIDAEYADLLNEDTVFWKEQFKIGLSGVKNVSSAIKGPFITLKPGHSKVKNEAYYLMPKSPMPHLNEKGLRIIIETDRLGGLKANAPIYYRQIKIGSVVQYRLNSDATYVDVEVFIEPCFAHLVRKNSYFYNTSGIGMKVDLFGAKMKTESLESILSGGIGVLTPDNYTEQAKDAEVFKLHNDFDESALKWKPVLHSTDPMCQ